MLFLKPLGLLFTALILSSCSFMAIAADSTEAVHFKTGASSEQYVATTTSYDVNSYVFYAKKDQHLKVTLDTKSTKLWVILLDSKLERVADLNPYSADINDNGEYVLPYTGKYTIRIGQYRAFARRGESSHYTLTIAID
ncbi:Inhibitor of g-type lysozyme precursor [Photobacterium malacitanum]|uniref:Inhibitor of g-type lysozyme n=1 Tax=Photobacterium malacitanum TaxID=2204294 RepID=A0A1Y6MS90_9GAMM|nr:PPC domain-containing protein [Photobacterium malacitanum]SMY38151.1 Inhibitor of g-type lysozyme precursor [Photobacterium malacitanum]